MQLISSQRYRKYSDLFTICFFVTSSRYSRNIPDDLIQETMKKLLILSIIFCLTGTIHLLQAQDVKSLTTADFKKEIWNYSSDKDWKYLGDKPAIVDLFATWCPPCKKLSPILEQVQKDFGKKIQIYKIDVDKEPEIAKLFNATSIPMMIFIPKEGKPFAVTGLRPQEQIEQIIIEKLNIKK